MSAGRFVSRAHYARICTAIWQGVHFTNFAGEKVACGVTGAARNNNAPRRAGHRCHRSHSCARHQGGGSRRLDAYAHHPYYGAAERDARHPRPGGERRHARKHRTPISLAVNKLWGKKPIWITEYGWQTTAGPTVRRFVRAQAAYLRQSYAIARANPRIDMMVWFMLRDDTNLKSGGSPGLLTAGGKKKPAFSVFAGLPH